MWRIPVTMEERLAVNSRSWFSAPHWWLRKLYSFYHVVQHFSPTPLVVFTIRVLYVFKWQEPQVLLTGWIPLTFSGLRSFEFVPPTPGIQAAPSKLGFPRIRLHLHIHAKPYAPVFYSKHLVALGWRPKSSPPGTSLLSERTASLYTSKPSHCWMKSVPFP